MARKEATSVFLDVCFFNGTNFYGKNPGNKITNSTRKFLG